MTRTFAVLGDSIAFGQGASGPLDTIGARLAARLAAEGMPMGLEIFAVPGALSEALAAQVGRAIGAHAEVALIIIGANDLTHFVPLAESVRYLQDAVQRLSDSGAHVVVAPAPDLSVLPWVPRQLQAAIGFASGRLRAAQTEAALTAGARVADPGTTSAQFRTDVSLFSADRFHPSSAGYALIAESLAPAVLAAARDAHAVR